MHTYHRSRPSIDAISRSHVIIMAGQLSICRAQNSWTVCHQPRTRVHY